MSDASMSDASSADASMPDAPRLLLLDYGAGNLRSMQRALERAGARIDVQHRIPAGTDAFDKLVIPGVGAFGDARARLTPIWDDVMAWVRADKPTLGVCLGMQLLFERSHEHGVHEGLGVIPGEVVPLVGNVTVPNMGWHQLRGEGDPAVYFAHSFGVRSGPFTTATIQHGEPWSAVVRKGRITGFQFHPEKSGEDGLALLRAWVHA